MDGWVVGMNDMKGTSISVVYSNIWKMMWMLETALVLIVSTTSNCVLPVHGVAERHI